MEYWSVGIKGRLLVIIFALLHYSFTPANYDCPALLNGLASFDCGDHLL